MAALAAAIEALEALPFFSENLRDLAGLNGTPSAQAARLVPLLSRNSSLLPSLLQVADTAMPETDRGQRTIETAIARFGLADLRRAVMAGDARELFSVEASGFGLHPHGAWEGALAGALAAEQIASSCECSDPFDAFTAGLLRDCGKATMDLLVGPIPITQALRSEEENLSIPERERARFGFDHAEVSALIAKHWNIADDIVEAIRYHHSPPTNIQSALIDTVYCADLLCVQIGYGVGNDGLAYSFRQDVHERLHLDLDMVLAILPEVRIQTKEYERRVQTETETDFR